MRSSVKLNISSLIRPEHLLAMLWSSRSFLLVKISMELERNQIQNNYQMLTSTIPKCLRTSKTMTRILSEPLFILLFAMISSLMKRKEFTTLPRLMNLLLSMLPSSLDMNLLEWMLMISWQSRHQKEIRNSRDWMYVNSHQLERECLLLLKTRTRTSFLCARVLTQLSPRDSQNNLFLLNASLKLIELLQDMPMKVLEPSIFPKKLLTERNGKNGTKKFNRLNLQFATEKKKWLLSMKWLRKIWSLLVQQLLRTSFKMKLLIPFSLQRQLELRFGFSLEIKLKPLSISGNHVNYWRSSRIGFSWKVL